MRMQIDLTTGKITEHEDAAIVKRPIEEMEAERVHAIKSKASELIKIRYPIEKQSSAQLGIYGDVYLAEMKEYIADIIRISNEAEIDGTKVEDILWQ